MNTLEQISIIDADLAQHRGLLSAAEERRYIELVADCYNHPHDDEGKDEAGIQLELIKLNKILHLYLYDASDAVNVFYIGGNPMWITPDDRSNYMLTIEGAKRNGVPTVTFLDVVIPVDTAVAMIDAVNLYAMQCVGVTASHKAAINALETEEAVLNYDFTTGYPEKLSF